MHASARTIMRFGANRRLVLDTPAAFGTDKHEITARLGQYTTRLVLAIEIHVYCVTHKLFLNITNHRTSNRPHYDYGHIIHTVVQLPLLVSTLSFQYCTE